jgi:hypothetical protein
MWTGHPQAESATHRVVQNAETPPARAVVTV